MRRESDGKRVGIQMCDWAGRSCGVGKQGKTRVRAREEPIVRWRRGMAHHCQAQHGLGTATSGVHIGIIMKFGEALACVKSLVSRTAGAIYVVT